MSTDLAQTHESDVGHAHHLLGVYQKPQNWDPPDLEHAPKASCFNEAMSS